MKEVLFQFECTSVPSKSVYYKDGTYKVENYFVSTTLITEGFWKIESDEFYYRHPDNVCGWSKARIGPDLAEEELKGLLLAFEVEHTLLK